MEIIDNRGLLFEAPHPKAILTAIPKSQKVGDRVLVHWGVDEVTKLRKLNIDAPAPIAAQYNWPGRYRPFEHQRTTAEFLSQNPRAFCFNEQGTGKTGSAIWAADFLMRKGLVRRALIICPVSIMDSAWRTDLFSFAMHRSVSIAHGTAEKRRKILAEGAQFVIINFDGVKVVEKEIAAGGFDLIIVDEANSYKNVQTSRWKTLNRLVTEGTRLWMMTGTPAAQGPMDAHGLAALVNPDAVPRSMVRFRDQVMWQKSRFKWEPRDNAAETVHRVLQPAIRFTKDECLDLPDMVYTTRAAPMTKQQERYYNKLKKDAVLELGGPDDVTAVNAAVCMGKLLQIAAGAVYTDERETVEFDISARYQALREAIDESNHKVLVFVPFRSVLEILEERLTADGFSVGVISGSVPVSRRNELFHSFQKEPDPRLLLIQPQAAAHGVTLTAADTVVWWSPTASLETFAQANARVHRAGQTKKCTVVQLHGAPVEHHIYKMLRDRIDINARVVDLYKELLA